MSRQVYASRSLFTSDINLGPDYFSGNVISLRGSKTSPEFQWLAETGGAWNAPDEGRQKTRKPKWARARDEEIARAYLGEIDFEPTAIADWLRGGRALLDVSDRLVVFVHPADQEMLEELEPRIGEQVPPPWRGRGPAVAGVQPGARLLPRYQPHERPRRPRGVEPATRGYAVREIEHSEYAPSATV